MGMHLSIKIAVMFLLNLFFAIGIVSISKSETIDDLVEREALFYLKFTDTPFTGELEGMQQGKLSEGKKQGSWLEFWITGQLKSKGEYIDGKKTGPWLLFYTNGQLMSKGNYLEDMEDGDWLYYFRNGNINQKSSGSYKDGKKLNFNK
tara:strand:- start:166 stop:609 length:444 start_codon:yes stop_codon:yes gene_type:complete